MARNKARDLPRDYKLASWHCQLGSRPKSSDGNCPVEEARSGGRGGELCGGRGEVDGNLQLGLVYKL